MTTPARHRMLPTLTRAVALAAALCPLANAATVATSVRASLDFEQIRFDVIAGAGLPGQPHPTPALAPPTQVSSSLWDSTMTSPGPYEFATANDLVTPVSAATGTRYGAARASADARHLSSALSLRADDSLSGDASAYANVLRYFNLSTSGTGTLLVTVPFSLSAEYEATSDAIGRELAARAQVGVTAVTDDFFSNSVDVWSSHSVFEVGTGMPFFVPKSGQHTGSLTLAMPFAGGESFRFTLEASASAFIIPQPVPVSAGWPALIVGFACIRRVRLSRVRAL